jgi:hypothetical protein
MVLALVRARARQLLALPRRRAGGKMKEWRAEALRCPGWERAGRTVGLQALVQPRARAQTAGWPRFCRDAKNRGIGSPRSTSWKRTQRACDRFLVWQQEARQAPLLRRDVCGAMCAARCVRRDVCGAMCAARCVRRDVCGAMWFPVPLTDWRRAVSSVKMVANIRTILSRLQDGTCVNRRALRVNKIFSRGARLVRF